MSFDDTIVQVREEELRELDELLSDVCELPVAGGCENSYGKVNILLQSFISRHRVDCFSLVSDQAYVAQVSLSERVCLVCTCGSSKHKVQLSYQPCSILLLILTKTHGHVVCCPERGAHHASAVRGGAAQGLGDHGGAAAAVLQGHRAAAVGLRERAAPVPAARARDSAQA